MSIANHRYAFAVFMAASVAVTAVASWRISKYQTVVEPDGLHITAPFKNIRLSWDQVASVTDPSRYSATRTVMVTTTSGRELRTDVPDTLHDDFVAYAQRHGMGTHRD